MDCVKVKEKCQYSTVKLMFARMKMCCYCFHLVETALFATPKDLHIDCIFQTINRTQATQSFWPNEWDVIVFRSLIPWLEPRIHIYNRDNKPHRYTHFAVTDYTDHLNHLEQVVQGSGWSILIGWSFFFLEQFIQTISYDYYNHTGNYDAIWLYQSGGTY